MIEALGEVAKVAIEAAKETVKEVGEKVAETAKEVIGKGESIFPDFFKDMPKEIVDSDGVDKLLDEIGSSDNWDNGDMESDRMETAENVDKTETVEGINETKERDEPEEKTGGSYQEVKKTSDSEFYEVHHMPADSTSPLERDDGPAIRMEKEDHRQTASCGSSREAREYREQQKELIDQGKFKEALQMDIDDIHDKFGDKYDDAIAEMMDYVDQLEKEGKI